MSTDSASGGDEIIVELKRPALPARPGDDDSRPAWVDYVVALGADRAFVEGQAPYTEWERVDDVGLRELADRLGG